MSTPDENFEPFNAEWVKEMMRWRKADLVQALHNAWVEQRALQSKLYFIGNNAGAVAFQMLKQSEDPQAVRLEELQAEHFAQLQRRAAGMYNESAMTEAHLIEYLKTFLKP